MGQKDILSSSVGMKAASFMKRLPGGSWGLTAMPDTEKVVNKYLVSE